MEFFLLSVGTLVPILLFLVVIHELGHFATARSLGVRYWNSASAFLRVHSASTPAIPAC